jgi:hypothetical protein
MRKPSASREFLKSNKKKEVLQDGAMDAGAWSCGMVAGHIHDIPTCVNRRRYRVNCACQFTVLRWLNVS